jgi:lysophospholipid acyltransferase (LPLAT)-like uncharacterized protein
VAITPDGPKGPRCQVKSGVIELARLAQMPILPVAFAPERARVLRRSWDQFFIPLPGSRAVYLWGEPIRIPPEIERTRLGMYRQGLARRLDALTAEARAAVRCRGDR